MKTQLKLLVSDVRQFIEERQKKPFIAAKPIKNRPLHDPNFVPVSVPTPIPEEVANPGVDTPTSTKIESCRGPKKAIPKECIVLGWHLQPSEPVTSDENLTSWYQRLTAYTSTHPLDIALFLVLPEEIAAHRFFLETISRAITRRFAPSSVILYNPQLFLQKVPRLIVAPQTLLNKKFPQAQPHIPLKIGPLTLLPLDSFEFYEQDKEHKRALWQAIQHLFRSS